MLFAGVPLPARGVSLIVGAAKSGKTLLAVQEAVAIARGSALFGCYPVLQRGAAMIVEQDDPDGATSIARVLRLAGVTPEVPLYVVPRLRIGFGSEFCDFLAKQILERSLRLVILDSYTALRRAHGNGIDIVKAEQNEMVLLDELAKRTQCALQVIHHTSNGSAALDWSEKAAGTFAMSAATEAQIYVARFAELDAAKPERLIRIRGRHAGDTEMVLRFRAETLDYVQVLEGGAAALYPLVVQIGTVFGNRPFSPKELTQAIGVSRATSHRYIDRLHEAGVLRKEGFGSYLLVRDQLAWLADRDSPIC
jgi:hypothetical protein